MRFLVAALILLSAYSATAQKKCLDIFSKEEPQIAFYPVEEFTHNNLYRVTSGPFIFEGHLVKGDLHIVARLVDSEANVRSQLRGDLLYTKMINYFGAKNIHRIAANWFAGTNHSQFFENLKRMDTPEEAAAHTWSGQQAAKHGFTVVQKVSTGVDMLTGEPTVFAFFTKP